MAPSAGLMAPIAMRILRHAIRKTSTLLKARITEITRPINSELQPVLARVTPRQPVHPVALLRRNKASSKWYSTKALNATIRRFMSTSPTVKYDRAAFPRSATGTAVTRLTTRAPFASTLRPNLTGGALPRTAGGYSLGGSRAQGARYFSHTPAAPAQVVNNVSTAVRAFWLSGHKAQFDGINSAGEKRYRRVSTLQDQASKTMKSVSKHAPGSFIDFNLAPTMTALSPLGVTFPFSPAMQQSASTLNTEGFLDVLSVDFSRALKDYSAIMNDLKKLSSLGDLSITLEGNSIIRIRFPGCDADTVERLCDEVGVQRGIVHQDKDFDRSVGAQVALIFPFAPSSEHIPSSPGGSLRSQAGKEFEDVDNPWLDVEGYKSMDDMSENYSDYFTRPNDAHVSSLSDYEGLEGIYRFIEQCDNYRRIQI